MPPPLQRDSTAYRILARLLAMPRPVRGISHVMLEREFHDPSSIAALAEAGLITPRDWDSMPGRMPPAIWVPTAAGEAALAACDEGADENRR